MFHFPPERCKQAVGTLSQVLTVFPRIDCGNGVMTSFMSVLCTRPPYASGLSTRWTCHCCAGLGGLVIGGKKT